MSCNGWRNTVYTGCLRLLCGPYLSCVSGVLSGAALLLGPDLLTGNLLYCPCDVAVVLEWNRQGKTRHRAHGACWLRKKEVVTHSAAVAVRVMQVQDATAGTMVAACGADTSKVSLCSTCGRFGAAQQEAKAFSLRIAHPSVNATDQALLASSLEPPYPVSEATPSTNALGHLGLACGASAVLQLH